MVEEPRSTLASLRDLMEVLAPLDAVGDTLSLAESVLSWVAATVASDCWIHVSEHGDLEPLSHRGSAAPPDHDVLNRALTSKSPEVGALGGGRAWVVLPIIGSQTALGVLSLALDESELEEVSWPEALGRLASTVSTALAVSADHQRTRQISQAFQTSLLPAALPQAQWFRLSARYVPGTFDLTIGGDWYDAQVMADGTVALSVGDVAGHGIEAAARMGELRSAMTALRLVRSAPDELIRTVHRLASDLGYFATVVCARLDPTGNLLWASAGHLPPLVVRADGGVIVLATQQSPPLGVGDVQRVPLNRFRLDTDDMVLLYTDGLVERRDADIDETVVALSGLIRGRPWTSPSELIEGILIDGGPTATGDDVAVLAARWLGAAES
ncbi:MAG: PP2C family protein-serine/threonine phosphatase [Acidimicrobiales bacterium]